MTRVICIIWLSCFSFVLHSQINYDFESEISEWIQKPAAAWELTTDALSGNSSLRHIRIPSVKTSDTIFIPVNGITFEDHDVRWRFLLRHAWNPSGDNKWAVILAANSISNDFKGYAIGVNMRTKTTFDDFLCLYRIPNGNSSYVEMINTNINWEKSVDINDIVALEIRKSHNNYWQIGINIGGDFSNISFHDNSILDKEYSDCSYFGILHFFTPTASQSLYIDDVSINAIDKNETKASDTEIIPPDEQVAGGNISSLDKDTIEAIRFEIRDIVASDALPTYLHQVTVKNVKPLSSANWKATIKNAYLYAGNIEKRLIANTVISDDSIVFRFNNDLTIPSGETLGLSMKIVINDSLTDHSTLQFKIDKTNHGFVSSTFGSGIITELTNDIMSGIFIVDIEADTILWLSVPDAVSANTDFAITAIATDNKGNIDTDFSFPADLVLNTGTGSLTFDHSAFVNGNFSTDVSYNKAENISIQLLSESVSSASHYISIILDKNSSIENPAHKIEATTIMSDAVNIENEISTFRFIIKDQSGDNAATFVDELKFSNPFSETNWTNVIGGISLYDGKQRLITNIIDQKKDYIRIGLFEGSLTVDDGTEKEITLKIWLKTKVPDKTKLGFMIPSTNHESKAAQNGSIFTDDFIQNIVSDTFIVEVQATKIIFKTVPSNIAPHSDFSLEINAVNGDEMIDSDETGQITLGLATNDGHLSSISGMEKQLVEGKIIWNDLRIDAPAIFRIKAKHPYLGEITSDEIASMDMDSEILPVLSQQKSVFKSVDTLISTAKEVIRFRISDKGTNDGLATVVNKMVFGIISDMSIPDLIGGAELLSDGQNISVSFTSADNSITVIPDNLIIPDGESREIILKIFLKRPKCIDGSNFRLSIPATTHGWTVNQNSSQLLKTFEYAIYSELHSIDIEASRLTIINQPMIVVKNTPFSFDVGATDYIGNLDTSYNNSISIFKSDGVGNLQNSTTKYHAGISTFSAVYDSLGDFTIRASSADMPEVVSMPVYSANVVDTTVKSGISTWNNTGDWIWNGNKLRHNSGDGFSYVSAPMDIDLSKEIVQWDFTVENGNFDPSADNAFWCVLSSDRDDFSDNNLSGYVAGVNYTGNSDLFSFWKVKSGNKQLLWSSNYDWNVNTTARIIVQKTENEWRIFIQEKDQPILLVGKFTDNELFENKFSGFVFKYTSSRNGMFSIDNYEVIRANPPLKVNKVEISDKNNLKISFNANIAFPEALNADNYLLKSLYNTLGIFSVTKISDNEVKLNTELLSDTLFSLSISGITDISGSTIKDTIVEFRRNAATVNCSLEALSRISLVLEFSRNMLDETATDTDNYLLTDVVGNRFSIKSITKASGKFYIDCDSLQGDGFILYYTNLETEDGFIISDSITLNKSYLPAKISNSTAINSSTVIAEFSKSIQDAGNYIIKNSRGTIFDIASNTLDNRKVTLTLSDMLTGNNFILYISGAKDDEGFTVNDSAHFRYQTVNFGDLVFNEIMAKPNPPVSLPNREYLELYNRTGDTIYLTDFRILYGSGKSSRITSGAIAPHGYAIICASASVSDLLTYSNAFSATSFPSLLDAGMMLTLTSPDSTLIAVTEYTNSFYGDTDKAKGGWSLERIDPDNLSDNGNWKASTDAEGGTPNRENSVVGANPDITTPFIEKTELAGKSGLLVHLSERVSRNILSVNDNYSVSGLSVAEINLEEDEYLNAFELIFSEDFELDKVYALHISGISDMAGNTSSDTIIYIFVEAPKIADSKIVSTTELQITFNGAMITSDAQNITNYKLLSSSGILALTLEPTRRRTLTVTTEILRDSVLKLEVKNLKDDRGYTIKDTVIEFRRAKPQTDFKLESANRTLLSLTFNIDIIDSTMLKTANYGLINTEGTVFAINEAQKNTTQKIYLDCDSLRGDSFILYYYNLETEDGFILSDSIILNKSYLPAEINSAAAINSSTVIAEFSKSIQDAGNYIIKNSHETIFDIASKTVNNRQVTLTLSDMLKGNDFMLYVSEAKDDEGFIVNDSAYFRYQTVNFGDLVFNEIMVKPNPPVSLPNREYLELYNRTDDTIYLTNFRILYGSGKSSRITSGKIEPYGYAIICASASVADLSIYGNAFSATSFPSLLDAGMMLTLTSPDSTLIAVTEYTNSFYGDTDKAKGGWSLERIDPDNLSDNGNWKASTDTGGGTPNRENSVVGANPDITTPFIEKSELAGKSGVLVYLSERVSRNVLSVGENYSISGLSVTEINLEEDEYLNAFELIFSEDFELDKVYALHVSGISDMAGNTSSDTIIYIFVEAPKITDSKVVNATELQITFNGAMITSDAQNILNYKLKSLSNVLALTLEPTRRRTLTVTTEILRDSVLKLEVKNLKDDRGYTIKDTIIEFHRAKPQTDFKLESVNRTLLSLTFNIDIIDSTMLKTANYGLVNTEGTVFAINEAQKNTIRKIYLACDSLQGDGFILYYTNLETEDGFIISDSITLNKSYLPAKISNSTAINSSTVIAEFSKSIQDAGNYIIKNSRGTIFDIASNTLDNRKVTLTLSDMLTGNNFILYISGAKDDEGFTVNDSAHFRYQTVNFGDLVFNEIMAKPNTPVSLPNREYLELYNRTDDTIYLTDFRILYGSGKSSRIASGKIAPYGYAIICASASVSDLSAYGNAFSATSFPSLLDAGMMLTLTSPDSTLIAVTEYINSFYGDTDKAKGGYSLERIDPDNLSDNGNWKASTDAGGGTPGRENSIVGANPDITAPFIEKTELAGKSGVLVYLSERISRSVLSVNDNYSISGLSVTGINLEEDEYLNAFELIFSEDFELDKVYELHISGISDMAGNTNSDTIIYIFVEAPKITDSKVVSTTELQITFNGAMITSDAQNITNYKLVSSSGILALNLEPTRRRTLTVKTEILRDSVLKLEVKNLKDDRGYTIKDTVIEFRRAKPQTDFKLESVNRTLLSLTFNIDIIDSTMLKTANYGLVNTEGTVFSINEAQKNTTRKIYLACDSMRGDGFILYYYNLETEDGFILNDSIILNKSYLPAEISNSTAINSSTVIVEFNKNIPEIGNYIIKNSHGTTFNIASKTVVNRQITLTLSDMLKGNDFILYVSEAKDDEGFTVNDSAHFRYQTVDFGDLIFNEIMAKPNPPVSLPNREYLELYNRTGDTIYLTDFRILYGSGKSSRITSGKIAPYGYAIICASASVSDLSTYSNAFSATSFPSLLDAGMSLTLTSPDSTPIAVVEYTNSFYGDTDKAKGGYSLERIDPDNLSDNGNWKASTDAGGGTPGRENSIVGANPDITAPYIEKTELAGKSGLLVYISERVSRNILSVNDNYSISGLSVTEINLEEDEYLSALELIFSEDFELDKVYALHISGISDMAGNTNSDTIIYIFVEAPKITDFKVVSTTELQITFNGAMITSDAQNITNYKLVSSSGILALNLEPTRRRTLTITTEILRDSVLNLEVKNLKDDRGYTIKDTIIEFRRAKPQTDFKLESTNRTLLSLTFNINITNSTMLNVANYRLINTEGTVFAISEARRNTTRKIYLDCDSLQGDGFVLYYTNLETEDGFILSDSIILNKSYLPAKISNSTAINSSTVIAEFSKSIQDAGNYIIKNSRGMIFDIASNTLDNRQVTLTLSDMLKGNDFMLYVSGAKDDEGFTVNDSAHFRYQTVDFGDLVFNEIMVKPNPPVSLPNREYLELYNRTGDTIYLTDFRILYGSGKSSRITSGKIAPYGYAIICASASVADLSTYGNAFSATSFPSLLDAGMSLTLTSPDSTLIAVTEYTNSFYGDTDKAKGGWSLERIDPDNLSDNGNWKASTDTGGGTPGRENSVVGANPDITTPYIEKTELAGKSGLLVYLSERVSRNILSVNDNYSVSGLSVAEINLEEDEYLNAFELIFSEDFELDKVYALHISGISDMAGNTSSDTIVYIFVEAPKIADFKVVSTTELQITFNGAMITSDAQNILNYKLLSSSGVQSDILALNLEPTRRRTLTVKTEILRDSVLNLEVKNLKDDRGYTIKDTIIEFHREKPQTDFKLESTNRTLLSLTFNINITNSTMLNAANYRLINTEGTVFAISEARRNTTRKIYLDCDSLQGDGFVLYYTNLETEDGFILSDSIILNKSYLPAKISNSTAINNSTVIAEFSKSIQDAGNYIIKNSRGTIFDIVSKTVINRQITLTLSDALSGNDFTLYVLGAKDNEGFTVNDSAHFRYQTVDFGELVFNEIMAKPNPSVSLPDREYLELYNRTGDTVYLTDFRILYGSGKSSRITSGTIAPHGYAIICASASVADLSVYGNVFSATSFPSLLDAGMSLTLTSPDSTLIAVVEYTNSFYGDADKAKGGWSLERIDPDNLSDNGNWKASTDAGGGTPGRENSVMGVNPDNIQPYILKAEMIDEYSVRILFSENMASSILQTAEYYIVTGAGKPLEARSGDSELSNAVELIFDQIFDIGTVYELIVSSDIKDIHGNEYRGDPVFFGQMYKPEKENIVINEILFHPRSGGSDFVEIYNRSDRILDLSDISIASRNRTTGDLQQIHRVSEIPVYVHPDNYFVFTTDSASLFRSYYVTNPENVAIMSGFPTYPNEDGTAILLDDENNVIDEFSYSAKMHGMLVSNPEGVSLERVDFDRAASEPGNWQSAAQTVGFATPTGKNSCYTHIEEVDEAFVLSSSTFSPDGDGYDEVLFIDYKMPAANFSATVIIYNIRGNFVKEICRNMTLGSEGRLTWDGSKANDVKVPVGPYIIHIEAFNPDGKVYRYQKNCVIASRK